MASPDLPRRPDDSPASAAGSARRSRLRGLKPWAVRGWHRCTAAATGMADAVRRASIPPLLRARSAGGLYAIELDSDWLGLGARIVQTIEILLYCEERGLRPLVRYGYLTGRSAVPDYFRELFEYRLEDEPTAARARYTRIRNNDELRWPENYNRKLRFHTAKPLFDKYLRIHPSVMAEVDGFCRDRFGDEHVLGVHYRGTDKAGEAPLVAKERLLAAIRSTLEARPRLGRIFFSTDDQAILDVVLRAGLPVPVIYRDDGVRSADGDQFHRKAEVSKSTVNRDALVNMLLLSRSAFLLKTASFLSDCSVIFNPSLEVRLLNRPHSADLTWWPCSEILEHQPAS